MNKLLEEFLHELNYDLHYSLYPKMNHSSDLDVRKWIHKILILRKNLKDGK